jgi:hypothetical protein
LLPAGLGWLLPMMFSTTGNQVYPYRWTDY